MPSTFIASDCKPVEKLLNFTFASKSTSATPIPEVSIAVAFFLVVVLESSIVF